MRTPTETSVGGPFAIGLSLVLMFGGGQGSSSVFGMFCADATVLPSIHEAARRYGKRNPRRTKLMTDNLIMTAYIFIYERCLLQCFFVCGLADVADGRGKHCID